MRDARTRAVLTGMLLAWSDAIAAREAVVEAVQMLPAWMERDGVVAPLAPGMVLTARDSPRNSMCGAARVGATTPCISRICPAMRKRKRSPIVLPDNTVS